MTTDRDLERAAFRFADTVHANLEAQVKIAWALERDRLYAELAELRDEVHALNTDQNALFRGSQLQADVAELRDEVHALARLHFQHRHSVKVEP